MVRALFPDDGARRRFMRAVGANTAMAAIASVLPIGAMQALAQDKASVEKKDLKIGFIPITCATPLIMADPLGFYAKEGLNVSLIKTAGWALIRDKMLNKEHDASHFLSPMPLAITMGSGSAVQAMKVATIQNVNGQAITLHMKHKDNRDPRQWKGFKLAVPFDYSMHNFLLRYYLAEHGLDPDTDVQIRVTPPPEMVANLRAGNIDHPRSRSVQPARGVRRHRLHPPAEQGRGTTSVLRLQGFDSFIKEGTNTFAALTAPCAAAAMTHEASRELIPKTSRRRTTSTARDRRGGADQQVRRQLDNILGVPDRADFEPFRGIRWRCGSSPR